MISKITRKHAGCLDDYLDDLFSNNKWDLRGEEYRVPPIEIQLRSVEELKLFCDADLNWMWTGMTPTMRSAINAGKPLHLKSVGCRKHQKGGRTYMVNITEMSEGWDSRVFCNPLQYSVPIYLPDSIIRTKE